MGVLGGDISSFIHVTHSHPEKATVRGNEKAGELSVELAHVLKVSLCICLLPQHYIVTQILKAATASSGASQY